MLAYPMDGCGCTGSRGILALEEFWLKYGHRELLDQEAMFRFPIWMKHTLLVDSSVFMLCTENCLRLSCSKNRGTCS